MRMRTLERILKGGGGQSCKRRTKATTRARVLLRPHSAHLLVPRGAISPPLVETLEMMVLVLTMLLTPPLVLCHDGAGAKPHLLFALVDGQSQIQRCCRLACLSAQCQRSVPGLLTYELLREETVSVTCVCCRSRSL
jgi:hypothetical protein